MTIPLTRFTNPVLLHFQHLPACCPAIHHRSTKYHYDVTVLATSPPKLCTAEHAATTDLDKATPLADFFAEQCTTASPQEDMPGAPLPLPENHPTFDFPPISELTVLRTLQHLPVNKSTLRRQNAFEHLIRIFRFLVIQFRCGKRQDTISDKRGIHNTRLTRHNRCG